MRIDFTEDEMLIMAMYKADSKDASLDLMEEALFALEQDPAMAELIGETINKLTQLTNEEYRQMDFSDYDHQLDSIMDEDDEPTIELNATDEGA